MRYKLIAWFGMTLLFFALAACDDGTEVPPDDTTVEDFDFVFPTDLVPTITLTPDDGWEAILQAFLDDGSERYWPAAFAFDEETLPKIGVRIKGTVEEGSGRPETKYALKLNFDYYDGEHFVGVDKLHLENDKPDPSRMREVLSNRMYRAMGLAASRTAYAWVNMGESEFGLYTMIQAVDKRFAKEQFGTEGGADDGNLYECEAPGCTLEWKGDKSENYHFPWCDGSDPCGLTLVKESLADSRSGATGDYGDVISFIDVLNNTSDGDFEGKLAQIFDVDSFLKWLAVAVVIADNEGYLGAVPGNFFLYFRPDVGKFIFIPWDHNKAYGDKKCAGATERTGGDILPPTCLGSQHPLIDRLLARPAYEAKYIEYVREVLDKHFTVEVQSQWIAEADALIDGLVASDPTGLWSHSEYKTAISDETTAANPMNLLEFVSLRRAYLLSRLDAL
jgi:spore coat protein CotH